MGARKKNESMAMAILMEMNNGYSNIETVQRRNIKEAFGLKNIDIAGLSFDAVQFMDEEIDLYDVAAIFEHLDGINIVDIKSSSRKRIGAGFEHFFFTLTANQRRLARKLKHQYVFAFVHLHSQRVWLATYKEVIAKAKYRYRNLAVQF